MAFSSSHILPETFTSYMWLCSLPEANLCFCAWAIILVTWSGKSEEHVEEVGAVHVLALGQLVRHVPHELDVALEVGVEVADGELVVGWDLDGLQPAPLEEVLLFGEDQTEVVLGPHVGGLEVVLAYDGVVITTGGTYSARSGT